jgi:hypothetical protein
MAGTARSFGAHGAAFIVAVAFTEGVGSFGGGPHGGGTRGR